MGVFVTYHLNNYFCVGCLRNLPAINALNIYICFFVLNLSEVKNTMGVFIVVYLVKPVPKQCFQSGHKMH